MKKIQTIINKCSRSTGIHPDRIFDKKKTRSTVLSRQMAIYILRKEGYKQNELAEIFGLSIESIRYAERQINNILSYKNQERKRIELIMSK